MPIPLYVFHAIIFQDIVSYFLHSGNRFRTGFSGFCGRCQANRFGGDCGTKCRIVLDKQHGRLTFPKQRFQLHARPDINVIERLVQNEQMRRQRQAGGKLYFLFLPRRGIFKADGKLLTRKIKFAQNGLAKRFIRADAGDIIGQRPRQSPAFLRQLCAMHALGHNHVPRAR